MNRFVAAVAAPLRVAGSWLFSRGRGFGVYLSRTRIDYRSEIGDPSTNSIVGAVVGWIARNFPEAPVRIVREGTSESLYSPSATGPGFMLRLLERPNPAYSGVLQWQATLVDWICRGDAYWFKVRSDAGRVTALWWIPQRLIEPRWPDNDPSVFIGWYDYTIDGVVYAIRPEDIVHFRNGIDPNNPRKGLSRLASLFREIFTDDEASNFTASMLRNLGIPGVVIAPANTTGGGRGTLDPETVKTSWMEKTTGDKRGEPFVSNLPIEVKKIAFSPQEMELKELRRVPEERISAVLGVPAGVAQLGAGLDRNTFTNYGEGRVAAYTEGVIPSQRLFAADLEMQLLPEFMDIEANAVDVWFDWTKVSAMAAAASALWKQFESAATKGLVKRSDFRRAVGLPTDANDDVYVVPNNFLFLKDGEVPSPPRPSPLPQLGPGAPKGMIDGEAVVVAEDVRCAGILANGEPCGKLLAEMVAQPYRLRCSRCKTVTEAGEVQAKTDPVAGLTAAVIESNGRTVEAIGALVAADRDRPIQVAIAATIEAPPARAVETEFKFDEHDRIIGKREVEV